MASNWGSNGGRGKGVDVVDMIVPIELLQEE
jgi:hypothetical protein